MKILTQFLKFSGMALLCLLLMLTCRKPGTDSNGGVPPNPTGSANADTISNHLQFFNATKKQGTAPNGPAGTSLKISFEDTLYLMDEVKRPIKFLHEDTTKNVAGVYIQVQGVAIGGTFYYDVPEVPDVADNDTVSVILIGIDPDSLPSFFDITIIPYDESGQPRAQTTRPVKIDKLNSDPNSGTCGLVLPIGEYWTWDITLIEDPNSNSLLFYNDPDKKWGAGGQFINGCCINGVSSYDINCSGDTAHYRKLPFATFFVFVEEILQFFSDGTFQRHTQELHALPDPDKTDFCGSGPGVVHWDEISVYYFGDWTIKPLTTPFKGDSLNLTLLITSKTGGTGYGRAGGIIHQLDCNTLALIKPDLEGQGHHEVSFFARSHTSEEDGWYVLT